MGSHTSRRLATRDVLDALRQIVQALRESSRHSEASLGIGGAQLFVLETLADAPALSLNDLAVRTHTHQSSVSTVVSRLVERRLVTRVRSGADARRLELAVSPRGRRLLQRTPTAAQHRLVDAVERLPLTSSRRLAALLGDVAREVNGQRKAPAPMFFADGRRKAAARNV